ncbi:hypothetical protein CRT60_08480 [Azospirillum palustre]|uniref:histidine kinase n=1 Tax=Azospirillum palustre TaxID=2044885 RepID=A0A2B8BKA3_9PROT|nr:hypothetical protein [Azospirillum palustre]PGH58285.1 hypothetical protein CRT60_08480 [Azospirillum palustre]
MSPSDHSLPAPQTVRAASAASAAAPAAGAPSIAAPAVAALCGVAVFLLSALGPLREAAPLALPLMAAGCCAAAGLTLLSVWRAARGKTAEFTPLPVPATPPPAPDMAAGATVRIAALEEALHQRDRQAAERLRNLQLAAMDVRAELACAIVHDMNNALGAVSGYADFLVSDLPADSPQADYASRVLTAVTRVGPGLRRLVSAARMEPVPLKPERAAGILDEAAALLRTVPVQPGSLAVRHDPGVPDPVCNAGLLARTLAGLAAEILAASGRAGDARLCLRASVPAQLGARSGAGLGAGPGAGLGSELLADQDDPDRDAAGWTVRPLLTPRRGPHILFELRVDGPPLADDVLSMLVDPLLSARACYRRGRSEREEGASWPAALLTARLHDGGLSLLTHPVEGTAVRLHIPAVPAPLRTARAATPQPENATPQPPQQAAPLPRQVPGPATRSSQPACKVLVVDADPASGDRFQTGLERQGFEVSVCDDLRDALDVVADEPGFFDAVVIGPGLSALPAGLALAGRLKALRPDLLCVLYGAAGAEFPGAGAVPLHVEAGGPADLLLPLPVDMPRLARGVAALAAGGSRRESGEESGDGMAGGRR